MSDNDKAVVDACRKSWEESWLAGTANANNCSGFFKSVARNLELSGVPDCQADGLVDFLRKHWLAVKTGVEARQKVRDGHVVAAGLKAAFHAPRKDHGHIVVIVDGDLYHGRYPMCWGGSIGAAQSQGDLSVGEVWNRTDRDRIGYYMYPGKARRGA